MTWIEAKETLAKAHLCDNIPCCAKHCETCELHVNLAQEKEAVDYLYKLMKERGFHD